MFRNSFQFISGKVNNSTMFGAFEVGGFHYTLIKMTKIPVADKIARFAEAHVAWSGTIHIVHKHVGISS